MKNYFITFIIFLILKIVLIINNPLRTNAENIYFSCNPKVEYQFVNTYSNPLYRCGDLPSIKRIL